MADETSVTGGKKAKKEPDAPSDKEAKTSTEAGGRGVDEIRHAALEANQEAIASQVSDLSAQVEALVGVMRENIETSSAQNAPAAPSPEEEEVALQSLAERFGVSADFLRYQHDQMKRLGATVQQSFDALATKVDSLLPQEKLATFEEQATKRMDTLAGENVMHRFLIANPELSQPENIETFRRVIKMVQDGEGRVSPFAAYDLLKTDARLKEYDQMFAEVPEGKKSEARKRAEAAVAEYVKSETAKSEASKPLGPKFYEGGRKAYRAYLADITGVERPKDVGEAVIEREILSPRR